ncbi:hypothetical protein [Falsiphaeobacter marinintestinus]|uniref:hypothetical protein n=1 Tax=Falsiphaeobacter marinintestinus TaxID=1492905 RepID=UPI0011B5B929|nr:hypothetical protein [Phaeobacter marinintestinus]
MNTDVLLIVGLILGVLCIPAIMSAFSESRPPRAPIFIIIISAAMVIYAVKTHPGGYEISDVPDVFLKVVGSIIP